MYGTLDRQQSADKHTITDQNLPIKNTECLLRSEASEDSEASSKIASVNSFNSEEVCVSFFEANQSTTENGRTEILNGKSATVTTRTTANYNSSFGVETKQQNKGDQIRK